MNSSASVSIGSRRRACLVLAPPGSFPLTGEKDLDSGAAQDLAMVSRAAHQALRPLGVRGLMLTGSVARGEGALLPDGEAGWKWLSDLEFQVIVSDRFNQENELARALRKIETLVSFAPAQMARGVKIGFSVIRAGQLARLRAAIFSREMLEHGKLLWGDPSAIPLPGWWRDGCIEVPREDAFRLLNNRIVQKLGARMVCTPKNQVSAYILSKFWIELATSISVFVGRYRSSYQGRQAEMTSYLATPDQPFGGIGHLIAARLPEAIEAKLGRALATPGTEERFREAASAAMAVWNWETMQLTGKNEGDCDWRTIFERLRMIESPRQRMRDWARLIRRRTYCGSSRSALAAAMRMGSLANAIYGSACALEFFWDGFAEQMEECRTMPAFLARLMGVDLQSNADCRTALVRAVTSQWERHLRFAPA